MKKIIALLLVLTMTLALAACGGSRAPASGSSNTPAAASGSNTAESAVKHDPVTVTIYSECATNGANEAKKAAFENLYPWITVQIVEMPAGATDRYQTLSTIFQAKDSTCDVFYVDCTWPASFASCGWLEPLDDVYTKDELKDFSAGALQGCYVDGKLYSLPVYVNPGAMLYRTDLLKKYNFEPAKTWDEMIEQCKTISAGEKGVYGYAGAWAQAEALTCCAMEFIWSYGGDVLDGSGKPTFNTPQVNSALTTMKRLVDSGITIDGITGMASAGIRSAFYAGNVVYMRDWATAVANTNDPTQSKVVGNVGVCPMPAGKSGDETYCTNGGWNIGVSPFSQHKDEAKLLIKYWTSYDANIIDATMNGKMPARNSCYKDESMIKNCPDIVSLTKFAETVKNRPGSIYYEEVSAGLQQAVTDILYGADVDKTLTTLQKTEEDIYSR